LALTLIRAKLKIPEDQFYINVQKYGNLVGASIPMALHDAIQEKKIERGDKVLLLGTAAGLTLGTMGIQY